MRFLCLAYACEPDRGSEPGVGYNFTRELARSHEVIVVTRRNNIHSLPQTPNIEYIGCDVPFLLNLKKRLPFGLYIYYFAWHILAMIICMRILRSRSIDYTWQFSFGNCLLPNFSWLLPGKVILGPFGGGEVVSIGLYRWLSWRDIFKDMSKRLILYSNLLNPFFYLRGLRSKLIICRTESTLGFFKLFGKKALLHPDVGIDFSIKQMVTNQGKTHECPPDAGYIDDYIVWVGTLESWRGLRLLLAAWDRENLFSTLSIVIIGDGPDERFLRSEYSDLVSSGSLSFLGRLSKKQTASILLRSCGHINSCLKEGGVTITTEAACLGIPTFCIRNGGFERSIRDLVYSVAFVDYETFCDDLRQFADLTTGSSTFSREMTLKDLSWADKVLTVTRLLS